MLMYFFSVLDTAGITVHHAGQPALMGKEDVEDILVRLSIVDDHGSVHLFRQGKLLVEHLFLHIPLARNRNGSRARFLRLPRIPCVRAFLLMLFDTLRARPSHRGDGCRLRRRRPHAIAQATAPFGLYSKEVPASKYRQTPASILRRSVCSLSASNCSAHRCAWVSNSITVPERLRGACCRRGAFAALRFSSASSAAQRIMPSLNTPRIFAGFKFATMITVLPTSALPSPYHFLMPDTTVRSPLSVEQFQVQQFIRARKRLTAQYPGCAKLHLHEILIADLGSRFDHMALCFLFRFRLCRHDLRRLFALFILFLENAREQRVALLHLCAFLYYAELAHARILPNIIVVYPKLVKNLRRILRQHRT